MTYKRAFEALLDEYVQRYVEALDATDGVGTEEAKQVRAAVLAAYTDLEERERMRLAGISTAALGYWKEGDSIHPDYDTVALRDVAKLYAKYDELYQARDAAAGREGQPIGYLCVDKNNNPARSANLIHNEYHVAFVYKHSPHIPKLLDVAWPANAPHRLVPIFTHPAPKADAAADWPTDALKAAREFVVRYYDYQHSESEQQRALILVDAALAASPARGGEACVWTYEPDGFWTQECGGAWAFTEGTMAENNCRFCPSCGKTIDAAMSREAQG